MSVIRKVEKKNKVQFYLTEQYACSYIDGQNARSKVAAPSHLVGFEAYNDLVENGFRRSGVFSYRPHCDRCKSCIPIRIPVNHFSPNKTQRRVVRKLNNLLFSKQEKLSFNEEHFLLYKEYQLKRHPTSGMCNDNKNQYIQFLLTTNVETELITFSDKNNLLKMVCIFDVMKNGLSSVYTFFSTKNPSLSYGTYGILWQIEECKKRNLEYLYLGYWISDSEKMSYKTNFRPFEVFENDEWK